MASTLSLDLRPGSGLGIFELGMFSYKFLAGIADVYLDRSAKSSEQAQHSGRYSTSYDSTPHSFLASTSNSTMAELMHPFCYMFRPTSISYSPRETSDYGLSQRAASENLPRPCRSCTGALCSAQLLRVRRHLRYHSSVPGKGGKERANMMWCSAVRT